MKIYEVEASVKIKTTVWIDDEKGESVSDLSAVLKKELEGGELDYEIIGEPVIDDENFSLTEEVTYEEIEERMTIK